MLSSFQLSPRKNTEITTMCVSESPTIAVSDANSAGLTYTLNQGDDVTFEVIVTFEETVGQKIPDQISTS